MTFRIILVFFILLISQGAELHSEERITIVYTNSLNGNFDYCHCKDDPKGGLVKRATEIKKIRDNYQNVCLFETGDFFSSDEDALLAEYLIKAYKYIGYDSILFGDQEFLGGIDEFIKYKNELPFVCNNIFIKIGKEWINPYKSYIIIERENIKIGIIGSISKKTFRFYPKEITSKIRINDQIKEINEDIKTLHKEEVDLIFLLSHSGYDEDKILLRKLKGIDVVIGGHSQTLVKNPSRVGDSILVQAGTNGAYIGILELRFNTGKITSFRNSFRLPDEFQPEDDPYIRKLIDKYKEDIKKKYQKMRFDK
ncbi:MAG: hypothetical protein SVR08_11470 [Spirochaetota bacterium]|nr:hypothetical protein [Spirochaetota bacterium]